MRLREMQGILGHAIEALSFQVKQEPLPNGTTGGRVSDLRVIAAGLSWLTELPAIADAARLALAQPYFQHPESSFFVELGAANNFAQAVSQVREQAVRLKAMVDATLPTEQPFGISVKFPMVSTLDDVGRTVSEIDLVVKQTLLSHYEMGGFRVAGFDTGSMWIEITLDTKEALALILAVASVALRLVKYRGELRSKEDEAKASLQAAQVETMTQVFVELLKAKRTEWSAEIAPRNATSEDKARLLAAVDTMTDLTAAGAAVVPALSAPSDAKDNYVAIVKAFEPPKREPPQLPSGPTDPSGKPPAA